MTKKTLSTKPTADRPPARQRRIGWSPEMIAVFLDELRATASVSDACRAVGKSRSSAYRLYNRKDADHIRTAWDEALRAATRVLADTAFERAVKGVREEVYHEGRLIGYRTKHDNRHLQWMLRVRDPLNWAPLNELEGWMLHRNPEKFEAADGSLRHVMAEEHKIANEKRGALPPVDSEDAKLEEAERIGGRDKTV